MKSAGGNALADIDKHADAMSNRVRPPRQTRRVILKAYPLDQVPLDGGS